MTVSTRAPARLMAAEALALSAIVAQHGAGGSSTHAVSPVLCRLCGHSDRMTDLADPSLAHLIRCRHCGLVCVRDFPDADRLSAIYGEAYYASPSSHIVGYDNYEADRANIWRTSHRRLQQIARYAAPPGRLLDVGCALGFFMGAAEEAGWHTTGVDVSPYAARYARDLVGRDVHCGEIDQVDLGDTAFDVITLWDVVEHMVDPLAQLRACRRRLVDGGLIVISTPDIGSVTARLTGARWMGFKLADEHVYYFSRPTITRLLREAGFEIVDVRPIGKYVTLGFFFKRLELYAEHVANFLAPLVRGLRLDERAIYVNPLDIVCVIARKPA